MKNLLSILYVTLVSLFLMSCGSSDESPKPAVDERDKFVGLWNGNMFEVDSDGSADLVAISVDIVKGAGANDINLRNPLTGDVVATAIIAVIPVL